MTKIKICGITNEADAKAAVALGVDALGFNFYEKSSRYIQPEAAQVISRLLPANIWRVGVFVDCEAAEVERIARLAALSALQFHGNESADYCKLWKSWIVIKAIRPSEGTLSERLAEFESIADYFLVDRFDPASFGGTGKVLEENWLSELEQHPLKSRCFLAGGLTPENVEGLVRRIKPFGVDVASGIESAPGKKAPEKMQAFLTAVKRAAA